METEELQEWPEDTNVPAAIEILNWHIALQHQQWDGLDSKGTGMFAAGLAILALIFGAFLSIGDLFWWQWIPAIAVAVQFVLVAALTRKLLQPADFYFGPQAPALMAQIETPRAPRAWAESLADTVTGNKDWLEAKSTRVTRIVRALSGEVILAILATAFALALA